MPRETLCITIKRGTALSAFLHFATSYSVETIILMSAILALALNYQFAKAQTDVLCEQLVLLQSTLTDSQLEFENIRQELGRMHRSTPVRIKEDWTLYSPIKNELRDSER
jgi:hypothetical protein